MLPRIYHCLKVWQPDTCVAESCFLLLSVLCQEGKTAILCVRYDDKHDACVVQSVCVCVSEHVCECVCVCVCECVCVCVYELYADDHDACVVQN